MPVPSTKVPVGLATTVGLSGSLTSLVAAILTYLTGDKSAQSVNSIALAIISVVLALVVMVGRYIQGNNALKSDLVKAEKVVDPVVKTIESADPSLLATIESKARAIVLEEIGKLPKGAVQSVATDVVADATQVGQIPPAVTAPTA